MPANNSADVSRREAGVWPLPLRVAFRFCFLYWLLYILPSEGAVSIFDLLPFGGIGNRLSAWLGWPLAELAHVVGVRLFHLSGEAADWHPTGSGDTAMQYTLVFCVAVLALVGTVVWSAIDERRSPQGTPGRGRREYRTAYAWLRLALRVTLAITLLGYGFAKIYPGQFGAGPALSELNETYGQSSPMHLLWFFMGYSRPYAIFGGLMEAIPGVLLLFERTETIGALGAAAVMLDVAVLNFCYDVPVKLYSTHLLVMSLFLLLPDFRPMWEFFVRRRTAVLSGVWVPRTERRGLRIARRVALGLVCFLCVWVDVLGGYMGRAQPQPHAPLYGVWKVDSATGWPGTVKPMQIVLDGPDVARVETEKGPSWQRVQYDAGAHSIRFVSAGPNTVLSWSGDASGAIALQGSWMGNPVTVQMHRVDPDRYLLTSRGFHWVQEYPFNR